MNPKSRTQNFWGSFLSHLGDNSVSSIVFCPLCPNPIRTIHLRIPDVCPPPFFYFVHCVRILFWRSIFVFQTYAPSVFLLCSLCPNAVPPLFLLFQADCIRRFTLHRTLYTIHHTLYTFFLCLCPLDGCLPLCGEGSLWRTAGSLLTGRSARRALMASERHSRPKGFYRFFSHKNSQKHHFFAPRNLHISKFFRTFAPDLGDPTSLDILLTKSPDVPPP